MALTRNRHSIQTKVKVALEAIRGARTTAEISSQYSVHATQINTWKKQALEAIAEAFSSKKKRREDDQEALVDELYKQIGQLTVERDWLKKSYDLPA